MAKPRILIADDEEGIRESLRLILVDDYELTFAKDGAETMTKLATESFNVVLLDIKMPKLDGMEILKHLRAKQTKIPVLMITAYQSVDLAKEAVRLGASDYLPKPFERVNVLKAIQDALNNPRRTA